MPASDSGRSSSSKSLRAEAARTPNTSAGDLLDLPFGVPGGREAREKTYGLLSEGLGNQVGIHVYDSRPPFELNVPSMLGMMLASGAGRGRGGDLIFGSEPFFALALVSLNSPVYLSLPVADEKVVDDYLNWSDAALSYAARNERRGGWVSFEYDFYKYKLPTGEPARAFGLRFDPARISFYWARIGRGVYVATKPFILEDIAALHAQGQPAGSAAATSPTADEDLTGHALARVRAGNWNEVLPDYNRSWAENEREACLNNLGPLASAARALTSAPPSAEAAQAPDGRGARPRDRRVGRPARGRALRLPGGRRVPRLAGRPAGLLQRPRHGRRPAPARRAFRTERGRPHDAKAHRLDGHAQLHGRWPPRSPRRQTQVTRPTQRSTRHMRHTRARLALLLLALLIFSHVALAQTLEERLKEIDEYAAKAGREWKVPGFSVAIVKDDRVVFVKGYGVRELGKPEPVDKDTLFAVASNTKAFTSAALATLVDEGKLKWDDPVTKYLPWFQLYDPYVTREMTVRDLLSHRSGLATFGGDLLWYETTYSREEIIRRVRFLKPRPRLPRPLRLPEHHVPRRGRDRPGRDGQELGRLRPREVLHAARHDAHRDDLQAVDGGTERRHPAQRVRGQGARRPLLERGLGGRRGGHQLHGRRDGRVGSPAARARDLPGQENLLRRPRRARCGRRT